MLPDFRQYYRASVIKTDRYWHKNRHTSTEQNTEFRSTPNSCEQLIFDRGGRNIPWWKDSLFSKSYWECLTAACKSMKLEHTLTPYTKIHSKWFKDSIYRTWHHKSLRRDHRQTSSDVNCTSVFFCQSPKAIEIKAKINKCDKFINVCTAKKTTNKMKRTCGLGENICKWCDQLGINPKYEQTIPTIQNIKKQTS